jgi:aconitate hydratase 2/2-methylisocitrate dehydratase
MGNQEKAAKGDTVMATSTRLFKVVEDAEKEKESLYCLQLQLLFYLRS